MMNSLYTRPYAFNRDEGQRLPLLGATVIVKAARADTGGAFNLFDVVCPPGFATPLHIHYAEDVVVCVLEGALTFFWGDERQKATPGWYLYQPRGTPHGFRVESETPARILYITVPSGLDQFLLECHLTTPNSACENDAARFKIEILGSLPE